MQNRYFNLDTSFRLLISLSVLLAVNPLVATADTSYDMSQTQLSAGAGIGTSNGQTGPKGGNSNVSFSDFGYKADNTNPRSSDMEQAADLLPINHVNTVTTNTDTQLPINSFASTQIKQAGGLTGTNPTQAPQIIPGQSTLSPTTTSLQSSFSPTALTPITSGQYSFGFSPQAYSGYNGPYYGATPNQSGFIPSALGVNNILPPTSMGSVDFNITTK